MLIAWLGIYFAVNRLQVDPKRRLDLGTSLDRRLPFVPHMAPVYFSTYLFVLQPFILLAEAKEFYWMVTSFVSISLLAGLIHATVPSRIRRVENLDAHGLPGKLLGLFQRVCKPHGNFPSMHVALSVPVVGASFMGGGPLVGTVALGWAVLIALSTLLTKQHYILDVLSGMLGGGLVFALTFWLMMT